MSLDCLRIITLFPHIFSAFYSRTFSADVKLRSLTVKLYLFHIMYGFYVKLCGLFMSCFQAI